MPLDPDGMARRFTLSGADRDLVGDAAGMPIVSPEAAQIDDDPIEQAGDRRNLQRDLQRVGNSLAPRAR
jgi:hypothetical protein